MDRNNSLAIRLSNISKRYTIRHEKPTLAEKIMKSARWKSEETFWALRDVNLEIRKGERVGIVGPNGSGKTTLLKIITGITTATTGIVETQGKIVSLIELESGFHPDLTGEENVYLNGLLVGMTKREINQKKHFIKEFADIDSFFYSPFHVYSSGMKFRLALAVAIASQCDILIIDEVFMAGDLDFQYKTINALKKLVNGRKLTLIICSHEPMFIWEFSDKFFSLSHGILSALPKKNIWKKRLQNAKIWKKMFPTVIELNKL